MDAATPYLQHEQPWLNALQKTVISQSSQTKPARLLNVNERQRTKWFLKLPTRLLHSRPSLKGMSVLLPLREVIILFLSENNKWSLTMGCIFWSWNLSVARRRGFNFLFSTGHFFFFFFFFSTLALCLSRERCCGSFYACEVSEGVFMCPTLTYLFIVLHFLTFIFFFCCDHFTDYILSE